MCLTGRYAMLSVLPRYNKEETNKLHFSGNDKKISERWVRNYARGTDVPAAYEPWMQLYTDFHFAKPGRHKCSVPNPALIKVRTKRKHTFIRKLFIPGNRKLKTHLNFIK
jgi:hypothetical protein